MAWHPNASSRHVLRTGLEVHCSNTPSGRLWAWRGVSMRAQRRPATMPQRYPVSVCGISLSVQLVLFVVGATLCALFVKFSVCFFEGYAPSGGHFLGAKGAGGWSQRLGGDLVLIFGGFGPPFGASWEPLWRAFGRQKLQRRRLDSFFETFWEPRNKHRKDTNTNQQLGRFWSLATRLKFP